MAIKRAQKIRILIEFGSFFVFDSVGLANFSLAVAVELVFATKGFVTRFALEPFDVRVGFLVALPVVSAQKA